MFNVMIVDDEMTILRGLGTIVDWENLNCSILHEASDGIEAFEKIVENPPDIVITDIRMPGMDGLDLAKNISMQYSDIKVIILTGYADFEYARTAIRYGVLDFVLKPTEISSIENAVSKAVSLIESEANKQNQLPLMHGKLINDSAANNNYIINQVNKYITKNYRHNIRLANIAAHAHVNSSYLSRLYHQETNITLTEAISRFRIEKAKELLRDPKIKVYEVANLIGIEEASYFSLMFKKYTGYSPTEYRKII